MGDLHDGCIHRSDAFFYRRGWPRSTGGPRATQMLSTAPEAIDRSTAIVTRWVSSDVS